MIWLQELAKKLLWLDGAPFREIEIGYYLL